MKVSEMLSSSILNSEVNRRTWEGFGYNMSTFSSIQDAISKIGSQIATLQISQNVPVVGDLVIPSNIHLWFSYKGRFTVSSGVTLTVNGPITAGLYQIFDGPGTVNGSNAKIDSAYPEWFGAKVDDPSFDNAPIFDRTQRFFPNVKLSLGNYYFRTLFKSVYAVTFEGSGRVTDLGYDMTNIIQLSDLPTIQLDSAMLTMRNLTIRGDINNPNNDGIYFPSNGAYSVFENVLIMKCGRHGIHAAGAATYGVDLCEFRNMKIAENRGYGIKLNMDLVNSFSTSKFSMVECTRNQLGGFYLNNCRSIVLERCHAFWNENDNRTPVYGYTIQGDRVSNLKFINCWSEQSGEHFSPEPSHKSGGWLINGGTNIDLDNCYTENEGRAITINGGTNIVIDNPNLNILLWPSSYSIYIAAAVNQVSVINYNMPTSAVVINYSDSSRIECTNPLPISGRIPYNSRFRSGARGTAFCSAQGSAVQYYYNGTFSANAGDNYLSWVNGGSLKIGDNILIPGAGASGGGLFAAVIDMDMVNKRMYIDKTVLTSITNQVPASILPKLLIEDYGTAAPTSGAHQVGDRVWNTNPSTSMGWVCTVNGSPGTWKTFGAIS